MVNNLTNDIELWIDLGEPNEKKNSQSYIVASTKPYADTKNGNGAFFNLLHLRKILK